MVNRCHQIRQLQVPFGAQPLPSPLQVVFYAQALLRLQPRGSSSLAEGCGVPRTISAEAAIKQKV